MTLDVPQGCVPAVVFKLAFGVLKFNFHDLEFLVDFQTYLDWLRSFQSFDFKYVLFEGVLLSASGGSSSFCSL